eukprot:gnl/MRDRNA2_/MRDRNA2_87770_c0_seq1.p1 gnl/MRDRNA2_/MRDRNA2_87770_c0~~gnl/MRDRNA2_/MRDRNA2_87770_c0_seq1.p1  ORF type:complete len:690 (+),score=262.64 gnl/MRDRNA2_/MRDRNA2_87770_c0_seq1:77-2146(+)
MSGASLALLCMAQLLPGIQGSQVNPIEKIIQMIGDLQQKSIKEGELAQKAYTEFAEWCEDQSKELRFEIKTAKEEAEDFKATIEKAASDMQTEDAKIEELSGTISVDESDLKAATAIRKQEASEFAAEEKELMDTTDALSRAITILERGMTGGASFMQTEDAQKVLQLLGTLVESQGVNTEDMSKLTNLLQSQDQNDDEMDQGAPDPAAYKSKSGGIVDQMSDILDKSEAQLAEARKKETEAKHNYELMKMGLEDAIAFANKELDKSKKRKAEAQEVKAIAEGEMETTTKDLAEDMARLADIHHQCMGKAEDFEVETASRAEELKALATAKKILTEMTGGATSQSYGLVETSFLQVSARTHARSEEGAGTDATRLVRRLARKHKSVALEQLADRMAAAVQLGGSNGDDPFAKVKGMIETMIEKLLEEAQAEAKQKAYCDKEMSETETTKADKEDEIADLTAKIDKMSSESKALKEETAILSKELADLAKSQSEMDKLRQEEKAAFEENKAEMEQGIEGVKLALKVLREYYAKEDKGHDAGEGAGAGIIGMLEVVESDFSKGLEELISTEESAIAEFEKTTQENKVAKATKEQDVKYKTQESKALDKAVSEATADRTGVQTELDSVLEYYEKLKPMCISKPEPYEERKKRREEEIEGLKNALSILEGEAVLLQKATTHKTIRHLRHAAAF